MMSIFKRLPFMMLVIMTIICAGCRGGSSDSSGDQPLAVTVSIDPQRWLLEQIGGDRVAINTLMPQGANPENFDPALSVIRGLQRSKIYFRVGPLDFENGLIARAAHDSLRVVDTSEGIDLIRGTHGHHHPGHAVHEVDQNDPHVWSSIRNLRIMAYNMLRVLEEEDSVNADYYRERHAALDARLDSADQAYSARLAPVSGMEFVVWHPSLSYFARDYSLRQMALGEENKEMSVSRLRQRLSDAGSANARIMFVQRGFDGSRVREIADGLGMQVVEINPLEADVVTELNEIVNSLAK